MSSHYDGPSGLSPVEHGMPPSAHSEGCTEDVKQRAQNFVLRLSECLVQDHEIASMSATVYDTAWVSMIMKPVDGKPQWLFPKCFEWVLAQQQPHGGWVSYGSEIDGILNTMVALLSMKKHAFTSSSSYAWIEDHPCHCHDDLETRIRAATTSLQQQLEGWDVNSCLHVGFEVLVPALLEMCSHHGLHFHFPGQERLMTLNHKKLAKFDTKILYSSIETTLVHSLEAFVGQVDYNLVRHHIINGSMMASPAATAAYLMNCEPWDEEAERYLEKAILYGEGSGSGGVPSAFPSPIFELTWSLSTLLESGLTKEEMGTANVSVIGDYLEQQLRMGQGVLGFAPGLLSDADDTAKAYSTLALMGREIDCEAMVKRFEADSHFATYPGERNASFSANCNILSALLHSPVPSRYNPQIEKAVIFLCDQWDKQLLRDKWNLSSEYAMMLLSQALTNLLYSWDQGSLVDLDPSLVENRVPIALTQIVSDLLHKQSEQGSWGSTASCEITAYSIITLKTAVTIPWLECVKSDVELAISRALSFLNENAVKWDQGDYIWVEKVTYRSSRLSQAYCIAAASVPQKTFSWGERAQSLLNANAGQITKFTAFFSRLPLFSHQPEWQLRFSLAEAHAFLPRLQRHRLDVFPRTNMAKDSYLTYIPFTWVGIKNLHRTGKGAVLSNEALWEMMLISMLNYQVDEFMETAFATAFTGNDALSHDFVTELFSEGIARQSSSDGKRSETTSPAVSNATQAEALSDSNTTSYDSHSTSAASTQPSEPDSDVQDTTTLRLNHVPSLVQRALNDYIYHILQHSSVQASTPILQRSLSFELQRFLHAHIHQNTVNHKLARSKKATHDLDSDKIPAPKRVRYNPTRSLTEPLFVWARGTAAQHTSCLFSFHFYCALIAAAGKAKSSSSTSTPQPVDLFPSPQAKYLSSALASHLATLCRLYNDAGSIARDRAEGNVNCADSEEFACDKEWESQKTDGEWDAYKKKALLDMAAMERDCLDVAWARLDKLEEVERSTMDALRIFVDVTDLYGQIYVVKDIASRVK